MPRSLNMLTPKRISSYVSDKKLVTTCCHELPVSPKAFGSLVPALTWGPLIAPPVYPNARNGTRGTERADRDGTRGHTKPRDARKRRDNPAGSKR